MKKRMKNGVLVGFWLFLILFSPMQVSAAGLIPCGGEGEDPCTLCHFLVGINGVINRALELSFIIVLTILGVASILYIVSAGESDMTGNAKNAIKNSLIGMVIMFTAWLMVNYTMQLLGTKDDLGISVKSWSNFECEGELVGTVEINVDTSDDKKEVETEKKCGFDDKGKCYEVGVPAGAYDCPTGMKFLAGGNDCSIGKKCCIEKVVLKEMEACTGTSMSRAAGTNGKCVKEGQCQTKIYILKPVGEADKCDEGLECCSLIDGVFK